MKIQLDKDVAEDLISFKLRRIQGEINIVLKRWNESDSSAFLEKAKNGTYSEAEMDAIALRQLLLEEKRLIKLYNSIQR